MRAQFHRGGLLRICALLGLACACLASGTTQCSATEDIPRYKCHDLATFGISGFCHYTSSLCLEPDGDLVVLDDEVTPGRPLESAQGLGTPYRHARYSGLQTSRYGVSAGLPARSYMQGRFEPRSYLENREVEWTTEPAAMVGFDSQEGTNIYHYAVTAMVGWHIQQRMLQDSQGDLALSTKCSLFESVVVNRREDSLSSWQKGLLNAVYGEDSCTNYIYADKIKPNVTYALGTTLCFANAYTLGSEIGLFSGPEDAAAFQSRVWDAVGLQKLTFPGGPDGKILFFKRLKPPFRTVVNEAEIIAIIEEETKRKVVVSDLTAMGFEEQVRLFAETAIVVGPHGAGLTNTMFMPQGAAVVELNAWPFSLQHYQHVAIAAGHHYYRFVSNPEDTFPNPADPSMVIRERTIRRCMDEQCQEFARDYFFRVDPVPFRRLMREVASMVFYDIVDLR